MSWGHSFRVCRYYNSLIIMIKKLFLSTVAALGSVVATATTLEEATSLNLGATTYTSTEDMWTTTAFTVSMTLDMNKLKEILTSSGRENKNYNLFTCNLRTSSNDNAHTMGTKVIYTSASSSNTTSSVWTTANGTSGTTNLGGESYLSDVVTSDWANAKEAALTMAYNKSNGSYALLSIYCSDGTILNYAGTSTGLKWSNTAGVSSITIGDEANLVKQAYLFNSKLDATSIQSIHQSLLPEPTTATLSLLALAGLATRRRRQSIAAWKMRNDPQVTEE